jgi:hypothetical protein
LGFIVSSSPNGHKAFSGLDQSSVTKYTFEGSTHDGLCQSEKAGRPTVQGWEFIMRLSFMDMRLNMPSDSAAVNQIEVHVAITISNKPVRGGAGTSIPR